MRTWTIVSNKRFFSPTLGGFIGETVETSEVGFCSREDAEKGSRYALMEAPCDCFKVEAKELLWMTK